MSRFRPYLVLLLAAALVMALTAALLPPVSYASGDLETQIAYSSLPTPITLRMPGGVPPYTHTITSPPQHGSTTDASGTVIVYTSQPGYTGPDALAYTLTDTTGASHSATVQIDVVPAPDRAAAAPDPALYSDPLPAPEIVPYEYLLYYRPGMSTRDVNLMVRRHRGAVQRWYPELNAAKVRMVYPTWVDALSQQPQVLFLEPNLRRVTALAASDPDVALQWALNAIDAYDAWDTATGSPEIQIAVIDTGVYRGHTDLYAHWLPGFDTTINRRGGNDPYGHGTMVAGVANAEANNGLGIAGVAWDARTLPVRVVDRYGATSAYIAQGVMYAANQGAQVINISLTGPGWSRIERDAINYAVAHGSVIIAAAGNSADAVPRYPAAYDHVIAVASTNPDNTRADFSSYGPTIDIAAPGREIYTTLRPNTYGYADGTSLAAPQVAGVAALVWSAGRATTPTGVTEAVLCTALDLGAPGRDDYFGRGLVQAAAAVNYTPGSSCLPAAADHDDIAAPRVINTFPSSYADTADLTYATSWSDDPLPCQGAGAHTVWYEMHVPIYGTVTLDTQGSGFTPVLGIYEGSRGDLTEIACGSGSMDVSFSKMKTYYVAVSSPDPLAADWTLHLSATYTAADPDGCLTLDNGLTACLSF